MFPVVSINIYSIILVSEGDCPPRNNPILPFALPVANGLPVGEESSGSLGSNASRPECASDVPGKCVLVSVKSPKSTVFHAVEN